MIKFTAPFISVSKIIRDFNSNLEGKDIVYSRSAYRYREWKYVETNKLNLNVIYFENKLFSYKPIIDNFTFNNKQKIKTFEKNNNEIYNESSDDIFCNETLSDPEMDYCLNDSFFDNISNISDISFYDIETYIEI